MCIEPELFPERTLSCVKQFFVLCKKEEWKLDALTDLLADAPPTVQTIVFCATQDQLLLVQKELVIRRINCATLSENTSSSSSSPPSSSLPSLFSSCSSCSCSPSSIGIPAYHNLAAIMVNFLHEIKLTQGAEFCNLACTAFARDRFVVSEVLRRALFFSSSDSFFRSVARV